MLTLNSTTPAAAPGADPASSAHVNEDPQVTECTARANVGEVLCLRPGRPRPTWAAVLCTLLALAACGGEQKAAPGPGPGGGAPPPEVGVVTVSMQSAPLTTELPGRVEASRVAQVRARVTGIVLKRQFREGSEVKAGQALFQIDPAPYQAAVDSAKAALAKAQANAMQATAQAVRSKPLQEAKAISQQEYVNAQAAQAQGDADVAAAAAALRTAQLNLGYATVTAPISGRIGRALVTEGALVSQSEATQLALIQQIDPVFVNSTQAVADVARLRQLAAASGKSAPDAAAVRVVLDDGSELPQRGRLLFSDLSVDPTTAQVTLRAEVANPQARLLPGMYVRTRLVQGQIAGAMLLPQQAVTRGAQGDSVLVVGEGGKPMPRPVTIGGASGANWIVLDGLKPGEQVIVEGFQKMRPGAPVKPVPWSGAGAGAGAGTAGAAAGGTASAAAPAAPASAASR
jgi:membrane fusion protein, multidrug efflux system